MAMGIPAEILPGIIIAHNVIKEDPVCKKTRPRWRPMPVNRI
jgi:hypothetical protein